jgi:hypothetical protein
MTTCPRSPRVFSLAAGGEELPSDVSAHAEACASCQAALAEARGFGAELRAGAESVASPSMPDLRLWSDQQERRRPGALALVAAATTVAIAVAVAAVAVSALDQRAPIGSEPSPSGSAPTTGSGEPSPSPSPSSESATPEPTPTVAPRSVTVAELWEANQAGESVATYGDDELMFEAWMTTGAVDPCADLEPPWMAACGRIILMPPDDYLEADAPSLVAAVHPDAEDPSPFAIPVVATVVAHYDDPAAADCRIASWPEGIGPSPSPADVIAGCRATLVITSIELPSP